MNAAGFLATVIRSARLEGRRLLADRWELAMTSWVPLLAVLLVWWVFAAGLPGKLPVGVLDGDHGALSRQLVRMLDASPGLRVEAQYLDAREVEQAMRAGEVAGVLVIPRGIEADIQRGRAARVELLHNAQWSAFSGLVQRDVRMVVGTLSAGIEIGIREQRGQSPMQARAGIEPIRAQMVALFNPASNYQQFLGATVMPALLFILAMTAGAWAMGRKLRDGDLDDWLREVAGASSADIDIARLPFKTLLAAVLGKTVWPVIGMMAAASLAFTLMTTRIHAPFFAWVMTWSTLLAFMLLSVGLGALLAAATMSLRTALSATGFISAPAYAFGGVAFPLLAMPPGARVWANCLPLTHYLRQQVMLLEMQAPLRLAWPALIGFVLAALVVLIATTLALRRACRKPERWGGR